MESIRFIPSHVEGLPNVTEVVVFPDRLELLSNNQWVIIRFFDIANWPKPKWLWKIWSRFGKFPSWVAVGERDWFHPPSERFFKFYTTPPIILKMPFDDPSGYMTSTFDHIRDIIQNGSYSTFDLG